MDVIDAIGNTPLIELKKVSSRPNVTEVSSVRMSFQAWAAKAAAGNAISPVSR